MPDGRNSGLYALLAIVVVLLVVLTLFMSGVFGDSRPDANPDFDVRIEVPEATPPQN